MIVVGDLHLCEETEATVHAVLRDAAAVAKASPDARLALLGDVFDRRNLLPVGLVARFSRLLTELCGVLDWIVAIPGNHDQVGDDGENALEVFALSPRIKVFSEPCVRGGFAWLPYRRDPSAYREVLSLGARLALMHHGLVGARMNSRVIGGERDGVPPAWFPPSVARVFIGHWHEHQVIDERFVFVGTPYQTSLAEAGQRKGFAEVDPQTGAWSMHWRDYGRRYFDAGSLLETDAARPGDVVRLPYDADRTSVAELVARGVEVRLQLPPSTYAARTELAPDASLDALASAYVEDRGAGFPRDALLAAWRTLRGE